MKKIVLFRWLALIPVTFTVTGVIAGLLGFVTVSMLENMDLGPDKEISITAILTSYAAIVWLITSYLIAPEYKKRVLWFFYIVGCFINTLIFSEMYYDSFWFGAVAFAIPITVGFITAIILHYGKGILNEIER